MRATSARNWQPEAESAYPWQLLTCFGDGEPNGLAGYQSCRDIQQEVSMQDSWDPTPDPNLEF